MVRANAFGRVALSYNGEVYNAPELREELAHGHAFRSTASDTEVVLNGYLQWKEGVFAKLDGMFAVAIWDEGAQKLVLARDPAGVKPLFYYPAKDRGILFGSEPKAILEHPHAKAATDEASWQEQFATVKNPGQTIWKGMRELKPGTYVTFDRNGLRERPYWQLRSYPHADSPGATRRQVQRKLEGIVHRQMVADVGVGTLLSGGLDSAALTGLAKNDRTVYGGPELQTFVVDFPGHSEHLRKTDVMQQENDTGYAERFAADSGIEHTRIELDPLQLASAALRERIVRARDAPIGSGDHDGSHLLMFEKIREQGITVVLSGEMADELFGGYDMFFDSNVQAGNGWPWYIYNPSELPDQLAMLHPEFRAWLDLPTYLADSYTTAVKPIEKLAGESAHDYRMRQITYLEIQRHAGYLLEYTDRLSMAAGLEVRVPYCDRELLEYIYNLPWNMKAPDGKVKGLLKDAVRDIVPPYILERPKSPYPRVPHPAYRREIRRQGHELLAQRHHQVFDIMNRSRVQQAAEKQVKRLTAMDLHVIDKALDMAVWLDTYKPTLA